MLVSKSRPRVRSYHARGTNKEILWQVRRAEEAQRQSKAEMADVLSKTVEIELSKQHAHQGREIDALQVPSET